MRRILMSAALSGALLASLAGSAAAGSPKHTEPGVVGAANCAGQTTAFLAQLGSAEDVHGIGNLAAAFGASVQEIKAIVAEYCAGEGE
ncbi:MAG: hypothetical protein AB7I38_03085 [Dehalococcoidia bacterium]